MKKFITAILSLALACGIGVAAVGCGGGDEYMINVGGGGSGFGIENTKSGTLDLGMASEEVTGTDAEGLEIYAICRDGIAVVVHPQNKAADVTKEDLLQIYTGKIKKWNQLDSSLADEEIAVMHREPGSGTRNAFHEIIGLKDETNLVKGAGQHNSTSTMMQAVAGNPNAIGYISLGSLDSSVKALKVNGVEATAENVAAGTYEIARPFNVMYKKGADGTNDLLKDFLTFLKSKQAHDIIVEEKYVSSLDSAPEYKVPETLPATKELEVGGSTSVQPLMAKLAEAYMELLNGAV